MKYNILYKYLFIIPILVLLISAGFFFAPYGSPDASVAVKNVRISPVKSGQVLSPGSAVALKCVMPKGCHNPTIHWKSSDPSIISISPSGVLRARRKGKVNVTLRIRFTRNFRRKTGLRTFPLEVGTPVESLTLGAESDKVGRGEYLDMVCKVAPADATKKGVIWNSSNPSVASVSDKGRIEGLHSGDAVISARARDGSGVCVSKRIRVYALKRSDTHFIAHRGLSTEAPENTITAFDLAGKAGFWGAECDIRESAPDEDGTTDLIVSHDPTFERMTGDPRSVNEVTAADAVKLRITNGVNHENLDEHICTLSDFLTSCAAFGMAPVIEIKESDMSYKSYRRIFWALDANHLADKAVFISFDEKSLNNLRRTFEECRDPLGLTADAYPDCRLISKKKSGGMDASAFAVASGYNGITLKPEAITPEVADLCKKSGLILSACTFDENDSQKLYDKLHNYELESATTNGKLFE